MDNNGVQNNTYQEAQTSGISVNCSNNMSNTYSEQKRKQSSISVILDPTAKAFFEAIFQCDTEEIHNYFKNLNYKPWEWTDEEGYTCLHRACFMNMTPIVNLILEEMTIRFKCKDNNSNNNNSAENNPSVEIMKAFVNQSSFNGSKAIHFASYRGNIEVIKKLINNYAEITVVNEKGLDVVHMAAQGDQPASLIFFKEKYDLSIEAKDSAGNTPLHWACYMGSENFFSFILSYSNDDLTNINIDVQDNQGLVPLHLAVISEKSRLVKKLLHKGVDVNITDKKGRTAYMLAVEKNKHTIVEMLNQDKGGSFSFNYFMRSNLEKTERTITNMLLFIILHLIIENTVFFLILPHFKLFTLSLIFLLIFFFVMCFFISLICSNPGLEGYNLIQYRNSDKNFQPKKILLDLVEKNVAIDDYCPFCIIVKSNNRKIKHCYYCNRCIREYDHHCYWVNNCIGGNNINIFFTFVTLVILNLMLQIYIGFYGILGVENKIPTNHALMPTDSILYNFPPFFPVFHNLHLYDLRLKRILCSVLIIISICFLLPVGFLWIKNIKNLCLRIKKDKKETSDRHFKQFPESNIEEEAWKLLSAEKMDT